MYKLLFALVLILAGCGGTSNSSSDGGTDGGSGGPDGGQPDGGSVICTGTSQTVVSQITRPRMTSPRLIDDGNSTMVIWSIYPGGGYLKSVWAQIKSGSVIAKGDLDFPNDVTQARLFTFKSRFYVFHPGAKALYAFDGTTWAVVPGFSGINAVAVSGSQILGVGGTNGTTAVLFDGTTATTPQKISNYGWGAIASDGTGFGAVTIEQPGGKVVLHFLTYNGSTWSTESIIGNATIPGGAGLNSIELSYSGGLWALAGYGYIGTPPTAWVLSGGTWTSTTLTSKGTASLLGNQGTFAVTTNDGAVATYQGGTWTTTQLNTGGFLSGGALAAYGSGYVFVSTDSTNQNQTSATFYDGASWGSPVPIGKNFPGGPRLTVAGSTIALAFGTQVVTYEGGVFTQPFTVTQMLGGNSGPMSVEITGSDLVAVYPEPGTIMTRRRTQGTWGQPLTLPASPSSGPVVEAALARASNGHALAAWVQWDVGQVQAYAAEYDGCKWGAPAALTGLYPQSLSVAATDSTFLIGSPLGLMRLARWTGNGIAAPQSLGSSDLTISSDGTSFVAAWSASGNIMSATSRDGQTWTAPQQVEAGPGWAIAPLTGGPLGVLAYSYNPGRAQNISARVWQAGAWSAPVALTATTTTGSVLGVQCQPAVANQSALIVCNGSAGSDSELFAGGAWSKVPIDASIGGFGAVFRLASDGTDYRIDYGALASSAVLHADAWSMAIKNPSLNIYLPTGLAGKAGLWTAVGLTGPSGDIVTARANGTVPYDAATVTKLSPVGGYIQNFTRWPGNTDALWLGVTSALPGIPVLIAAINL